MKRKLLICACAVSVGLVSSYGEVMMLWEFDDPAGTPAYQTVNSGSVSGTFVAASPNQITTDGNGLLRMDESVSEVHKALTGSMTTGHAIIRVDFAAWDFSVDHNTVSTYCMSSVAFVDSAGSNGALVGLKHKGSDVSLVVGGLAAAHHNIVLSLAAVSTNSLSVIIDKDLDADTLQAWYRYGDTAAYTFGGNFATSIYGVRRAQITNLNYVGWGGDYVDIDLIGITTSLGDAQAVPEASSVAFVVLGGACLFVRRKLMM